MNGPGTSITLLVPCYNAGPFIPRFIASVQESSEPFSRVLFYDDGSIDDTVTIARSLGLEIITGQPNRGVAHARNQLAAAAETEWIHFQDVDDPIQPDFLKHLTPFCNSSHDIVSCDADWVMDDEPHSLLIAWRYDAANLAREPYPVLLQSAQSLNNTIIRRQTWIQVGGCDESLAIWEDADVHIRMARAGARWHHVPQVLSRALRRKESFSHDYVRGWRCRLAALEKYSADATAGRVVEVLVAESERAAAELAALDASDDARRAVALCRRLGGRPPSSSNPLVRLLKPFVPAVTLLRWQQNRRRAAHGQRP